MNPTRKKRLLLIIAMVVGVALAAAFALNAFNKNMMFYFTPSEVAEGKAPINQPFRLGGMVVDGSVKKQAETTTTWFDLTDNQSTVTIQFSGILPDLFREGQGIISMGRLNTEGTFVADEVLAKHDENYMPPEVAESMKKMAQPK